jgi:hypothetical protein
VAGLSRGIVQLARGARAAPATLVPHGARLVQASGGRVLVVTREAVHAFDARGRPVHRHRVDPGVTALLYTGGELVVGYRDGTVERLRHDGQEQRRAQRPLDGIPSKPVTRLVEGPQQTLGIGFRDGTFGLWNLRTGKQLVRRRLHGPVRHIRRSGQRLYGATALGDTARLDLSIFYQQACEIISRIWSRFPATWDRGRAVRRPPPPGHPCHRAAGPTGSAGSPAGSPAGPLDRPAGPQPAGSPPASRPRTGQP